MRKFCPPHSALLVSSSLVAYLGRPDRPIQSNTRKRPPSGNLPPRHPRVAKRNDHVKQLPSGSRPTNRAAKDGFNRADDLAINGDSVVANHEGKPTPTSRSIPIVVWIAVAWIVGTLVFEITATG